MIELLRDNAIEFERIKQAKRGSVRLERDDDYVIVAHCHTVDYIEVTLVSFTCWYVSINYKGDPIKRAEFDDLQFSYDALEAFSVGVIVQHQKELKR